eukprot:1911688-Amphidinium_carterae.1
MSKAVKINVKETLVLALFSGDYLLKLLRALWGPLHHRRPELFHKTYEQTSPVHTNNMHPGHRLYSLLVWSGNLCGGAGHALSTLHQQMSSVAELEKLTGDAIKNLWFNKTALQESAKDAKN